MEALGTLRLIGRPLNRGPSTVEDGLRANVALRSAQKTAGRADGGGPSTASAQPPLYYVLTAVPYWCFAWASLPVRLHAMRVLSVLMFATAAALCALLVREAVPDREGAALVGGLAIALSPYTAFVTSGVTPDALLLTASTALLLALLRGSRRGLTLRRTLSIGFVLGVGVVTKVTFLAFVVPGTATWAFLLIRDRRAVSLRQNVAAFAISCCALPAAFLIWLAATGRSLRPPGTSSPTLTEIPASSTRELLSYMWQLFLPRFGFVTDQLGLSSLQDTWLRGFAGRYGWLDYAAPTSWGNVFIGATVTIVLLCSGSFILRARRHLVLQRNWEEIASATCFFIFLWAVIAKAGYDYHRTTGFIFEQPRYLFPVAAFYALSVGVASGALGRRMFPYVATVIVASLCVHDLSGVTLTLERYYG